MSDDPAAAGIRAGRPAILPAINRFAAEAVAVIRVVGPFAAGDWERAHALWHGLAPGTPPPAPAVAVPVTLRDAVERLATTIAAFLDIPAGPLRRTPRAIADPDLVLLPATVPAQALAILELAVAIVTLARAGEDGSDSILDAPRATLERIRKACYDALRGSRRPIIAAAIRRALPWREVGTAADLLQLGEGRRAVRLSASGSRHTGVIALSIASEKHLGNRLLDRAGVPVARQRLVRSADEVRRFAEWVGYPVVVKPVAMRRQLGVRFVYRPDQAEAALDQAREQEQPIVAESYLPGPEHRVLVVDGAVIAAFERSAPTVVGDGRSTIEELVAAVNADPERGDTRAGFVLSPIRLDPASLDFLASRGWSPGSVPPAGTAVECHPLPFVGYGGARRIDSTDRIHPDNRAVAVRAMAVLELDAGGIDFRCPDISRSWREVGAGICEVNPRPDLSAHYLPGLDRDVGALFLDRRCPTGPSAGRMPQILLLGEGRLEKRALRAAAVVRQTFGWRVGVGWPGGGRVGRYVCDPGGGTLPAVAGAFIENLVLDAAIYVSRPRRLLAEGVGAGHLDLALVERGPDGAWDEVLTMLRTAGVPVAALPQDDGELDRLVLDAMARYRMEDEAPG